jgi:hypothetical protein
MKLAIISFMKLMYFNYSRLVNQDNKAIVEEEFQQKNVLLFIKDYALQD